MPTAALGILFVVIGFAAMFLMYHLWGYPFDKQTRTSTAPKWAMLLHRLLGYAFAVIYLLLMWKMVPRLWEYQVEFPARTVVHICVGFGIGFLLLIKILIMRFFRHFEEWMPYLGTAIMLGTIILIGLSIPYAFQERQLAEAALGEQNRIRVAQVLPTANLPQGAPTPAQLSTRDSLESGRDVLLDNCVKCHDLKTVLAKPRSPSGWWQTVERMSDKPALFDPITERETYDVTAYLIAITPDLQKSTKQKNQQQVARDIAVSTAAIVIASPGTTPEPGVGSAEPTKPATPVDLAKAKKTYEEVCAQCHDLEEVTKAPPKTAADSRMMIQRMIKDNEAELTADQIELVAAWLDTEFVVKRK
ncbi:MAG: cytochrome c [Deltaproteobacteria bacterium]|nr:cytochrome c [Deltaproteobacteria bacterium]